MYTLLGTGSSGGVPRVGGQWGNCDPLNTKNRRRRCALLVEKERSTDARTVMLVDAGADCREQLLSAGIKTLDGVLLTHPHADHIFGLDDLRQLAIMLKRSIDVHMDSSTALHVLKAYAYCFSQTPGSSYPSFCNEITINHETSFSVEGPGDPISIKPLVAEHGDIHALGFRIDDVVYLPDMKRITHKKSLDTLRNTRVLVVDALRYNSHPAHMSVDEALQFIEYVKPERAILTNMHSDLDYETLKKQLPNNVEPGFDGMQFE